MSNSTAKVINGSRTRIEGSKSMPTDTKKSTAKASCNGNELAAALWLSSDSLSTTPAKKAPSAKETLKSTAEPKARPIAIVKTQSVNSSRDPVRATWCSNHGSTREPTNNATPRNTDTLASVRLRVTH